MGQFGPVCEKAHKIHENGSYFVAEFGKIRVRRAECSRRHHAAITPPSTEGTFHMAVTPRYRMVKNPETGKKEPVYAKKKGGGIRLDSEGKPIREVVSWKVEVWGVDASGMRRRKVVGSYTYKDDAKRAERDALRAIETGVFEWEERKPEPETIIPSVREACETWIRLKALKIEQNTVSSYEGVLKNHIGPVFGDEHVTTVTHEMVQRWVLDMQEAGRHAQTISRSLVVLSGALDRQVRSGLLSANPALGVEKPSVNKGKKDVAQWSAEQVAAFFEAASAHDYAPAFWLGELEGMRRAEILGLRWSDIRGLDTDGGPVVASIAQTCVADQRNGGRALLQPKAKTRSSERAILLTQPTVEALRRHRDKQAFIRKQAGDAWQAHDLVICNELGEPIRPAWFTICTKRMVKEAGLPELTPHALRHHALTRLLRQGVSPALAAQKAGHSDVGLVYRSYGHLVQSDQSAANAAIERELATGTGQS